MSKRIISLILCLVMLLPCALAGCGTTDVDESLDGIVDAAAKNALTLTLYLMSESEVSEAQEKAIETAVNKITKASFKTQLDLRFYTPDKYYEALDAAMQASHEAIEARKEAEKGQGNNKPQATEPAPEKTIINELGIPELEYPAAGENQVDIFYLGGHDNFLKYKENKWLADLASELSSNSALISKYVSPVYLKYADEIGNGTYIIPNNIVAGEYKYLLLNKQVLSELNYTSTQGFTSLMCDNVKDVLDNVSKYYADYVPLYSGTGSLDLHNVSYYGTNEDGELVYDFSVLGGTYDPKAEIWAQNSYYKFNSIFDDMEYVKQLKTLMEYKVNGYYGAGDAEERPFAVGYVKGGAELAELYAEDYEMIPVELPKISTDDIFGNGFAVCALDETRNNKKVNRCMEIITYINTNVELRNILLYGIEGENYQLIETGELDPYGNEYKLVRKLNNNYDMALEKTGNTMIAYPMEGELPNIREYQEKQNREAQLMLDIGFSMGLLENDRRQPEFVNLSAMEELRKYSASVYERIVACQTAEELDDLISTLKKEVNANEYVVLMKSITYCSTRSDYEAKKAVYGEGCAFGYVYMTWLQEMGLFVEVEG